MQDGHDAAEALLPELYRGSLGGFVERRTALARRLRAAGDREEAARVARLPKPALSAWAVDRVGVVADDLLLDLLSATRAAVEAQAGGDAEATRQLSGRVRALVEQAVRVARSELEAGSHGTAEATLRRIRTTLGAAAAGSAEQRLALWQGTLSADVDPPGFGVPVALEPDLPPLGTLLAGRRVELPEPTAAADRRPPPVAARATRASESARRRAAERELADLRRVAERTAEEARRRDEAAERLRAEAERAARDADAASRDAETAARRLAAAEEAARLTAGRRDRRDG